MSLIGGIFKSNPGERVPVDPNPATQTTGVQPTQNSQSNYIDGYQMPASTRGLLESALRIFAGGAAPQAQGEPALAKELLKPAVAKGVTEDIGRVLSTLNEFAPDFNLFNGEDVLENVYTAVRYGVGIEELNRLGIGLNDVSVQIGATIEAKKGELNALKKLCDQVSMGFGYDDGNEIIAAQWWEQDAPPIKGEIGRLEALKERELAARKAIAEALVAAYRTLPAEQRFEFGGLDPAEYQGEMVSCVDLDNIGFMQSMLGLHEESSQNYQAANECWSEMGRFAEMNSSAARLLVQKSYVAVTREEILPLLDTISSFSQSLDIQLATPELKPRYLLDEGNPMSGTVFVLPNKNRDRTRLARAELFEAEARLLLQDPQSDPERMAQFEKNLEKHIRDTILRAEGKPTETAILFDTMRLVQAPYTFKAKMESVTTHDPSQVLNIGNSRLAWLHYAEDLHRIASNGEFRTPDEKNVLDAGFAAFVYANRFELFREGGLPIHAAERFYAAYRTHPENMFLAMQVEQLKQSAPNLFDPDTGELLSREMMQDSPTGEQAENNERTLHYSPGTTGEYMGFGLGLGLGGTGGGALAGGSICGPVCAVIGGGIGSIAGEVSSDAAIGARHSDDIGVFLAEARLAGAGLGRIDDAEASLNRGNYLYGKTVQYMMAGGFGMWGGNGMYTGLKNFFRNAPKLAMWFGKEVVWRELRYQVPAYGMKAWTLLRVVAGNSGSLRHGSIEAARRLSANSGGQDAVVEIFKRITGMTAEGVDDMVEALSRGMTEQGISGYKIMRFNRALRAFERYGIGVLDDAGRVIPSAVAKVEAEWTYEILKRLSGVDLTQIKQIEEILKRVTENPQMAKSAAGEIETLFSGLNATNRADLGRQLIKAAKEGTLKSDDILDKVLGVLSDTTKKNLVRSLEAARRYGLSAVDDVGNITNSYYVEIRDYFRQVFDDAIEMARPTIKDGINANLLAVKRNLFAEWFDTTVSSAYKTITKPVQGYSKKIMGIMNQPLNAAGNRVRDLTSYVTDGVGVLSNDGFSKAGIKSLLTGTELKRHLALLGDAFQARAARSMNLSKAWRHWLGGIRDETNTWFSKTILRRSVVAAAPKAESGLFTRLVDKMAKRLGNEKDLVGLHRYLLLPAGIDYFLVNDNYELAPGDLSFDHLWGFLSYTFFVNYISGSLRINDVLAGDIASMIKNGTYAYLLNMSGNDPLNIDYNTLAAIHTVDYTLLNPVKVALSSGHHFASKIPIMKIFSELPFVRRLPSMTSFSKIFLPTSKRIWEQWAKPKYFGFWGRATNLFSSAGIIGWGMGKVTSSKQVADADPNYKAHRFSKMLLWGLFGEPLQYALDYLSKQGQAKGRALGVLFDVGLAFFFPPFHNKGLGMKGVKEDLESGDTREKREVWDKWRNYNTSLDFGGLYDRVVKFGDSLWPTGFEWKDSASFRFGHTRWEARLIGQHWLSRIEGDVSVPAGTEWTTETNAAFCEMFQAQIFGEEAAWHDDAGDQDGLVSAAMIVKYYAYRFKIRGNERYRPFYDQLTISPVLGDFWNVVPLAKNKSDLLSKITQVDDGMIRSDNILAVLKTVLIKGGFIVIDDD